MFNGIRPIGVTAEGGGRQRRPTAIANRYAPAPADVPPLPRTEETPVATVGATAAVTASAPAADSPLSPGTANPNAASGEGDDDNSPLAPNHLPFNGGTDFDSVPGEMDAAAQSFPFVDRVVHFLRGTSVTASVRVAIESCILIEAGSLVTAEATTSNDNKYELMIKYYINTIDSFSDEQLGGSAIKAQMKVKPYNAKKGISEEGGGKRLYEKYQQVRGEVRTDYIPKLPQDLSKMASGKQLRQVYDGFILDAYKKSKVSMCMYLSDIRGNFYI